MEHHHLLMFPVHSVGSLGDRHNFGHSVTKDRGGLIVKPRPVIWEHLFLDARSPLRQLLSAILDTAWLPNLCVDPETDFFKEARVQKLRVDPIGCLSPAEREEVGVHIGVLAAWALWFGIGDLHCDNVMIGRLNGRIVLAPIDLECVFRKYPLLSSTLILPKGGSHLSNCGLSELLKFCSLDMAVQASTSFIKSIQNLNEAEQDIANILIPRSKETSLYSRVVLRPTRFYADLLVNAAHLPKPELLSSELEQLNRGDIPYYFRDTSNNNILYFSSPEKMSPWEDAERFSYVRDALQVLSSDDSRFIRCVDDRSVQASALEILHKMGGSPYENFVERVEGFTLQKADKRYAIASGDFEARGYYRT